MYPLVVVSTWGLPKGWKRVKYKYDAITVESKSTLTLLDEVFKDERKVVVLPSTLADGECGEKCEIEKMVIGRVEDGLKDDPKALEAFKRAVKVVIPGTGKFMTNSVLTEFEAPTETTVSAAILKLYPLIKDESRVMLDVTHGVNFYPVTTRSVLDKLVRILSLDRSSTLEVGASDPFQPLRGQPTSGVILEYRMLESTKVYTKLSEVPRLIEEAKSIAWSVRGSDGDSALKELRAKWNKVKGKLIKYLRGLKAGSPLYWSYLLVELYRDSELRNNVDSIEETLLKLIDEGYQEENGRLVHRFAVHPNAALSLIAYRSLYEFAKKVARAECFWLDKVFLYNFDRLEDLELHLSPVERSLWMREKSSIGNAFRVDMFDVTMEVLKSVTSLNLKEIMDELPKKLKERLSKLDGSEVIKYLNELIELVTKDSAVPYGVVKAYDEGRNLKESVLWWVVTVSEIDKYAEEAVRNFLAHAGAEQNLTVLRRANDLKMIGYYKPALKKLENKLMEKLSGRQ